MPSLVAIFDAGASREALERDLGRMMEAVDLPAFHFLRRRVIDPGVAVGNVLPGIEDNQSQPVFDASERYWLMLDGEVLGVAELSHKLRAAGVDPSGKDDAQLLLLAHSTLGPDFYESVNGCFNLVLHDRKLRETTIVTDPIGSRLLFYAHDGARFVFASELKGVIAGRNVPSRPGGLGLYGLLMGGCHDGDRTWIEGIKLFPAGSVLRLSADGTSQRRYHKLRFNEGGPQMSEDDYADGFALRLRAATERNLKLSNKHKTAITLSGGLDSRAVALAMDPSHLPMRAITYGNEHSPDVIYARQLAQVIGLDHYYIEPEYERLVEDSERVFRRLTGRSDKQGFYSAQLDRILWRAEGLSMFYGLASPIWHPIYRQEMRFMLNGAAGDAMTGSHITPDLMVSPRRDQVIRGLFRRRAGMDEALLKTVLNPSFYARSSGELFASFASDFDDIDADEPTALANIWDMEVRQRRGSFTSFTMERYFCTCRSPFLDAELIEFLCRVPGLWRFQQRIYKRMLVRAFPQAAHVPWAYTEGLITDKPLFEFSREVLNFAKTRAQAFLPGNKSQPARWVFRDNLKMMREDKALHDTLLEFTTKDYFPSEVFDAAGVRALVEGFAREGGTMRHGLFTHLLGLARCIEFFLVPSRIRVPATADPAEFGVAAD